MKTFLRALKISVALLLICGVIYPLAMTGISQLIFPRQANGSIVYIDGKPVGSELLGQAFTDARFFHGRISAVNYNTYSAGDKTANQNGKAAYQGVSSGSSNLAPSNPALEERVKKDMDEFLKANPGIKKEDIPADLLTSSGSGLDPDISPEAAKIQIPAISKATALDTAELETIVKDNTRQRFLGIFGEPRVNVLGANIEIAKRIK
jgi:K+-transporting ATPase ATPase C chain